MQSRANRCGKGLSASSQEMYLDDVVSLFTEMAITADVRHIFSRWHMLCT